MKMYQKILLSISTLCVRSVFLVPFTKLLSETTASSTGTKKASESGFAQCLLIMVQSILHSLVEFNYLRDRKMTMLGLNRNYKTSNSSFSAEVIH